MHGHPETMRSCHRRRRGEAVRNATTEKGSIASELTLLAMTVSPRTSIVILRAARQRGVSKDGRERRCLRYRLRPILRGSPLARRAPQDDG
jgi:hypothetical protein